MPALYLKYRDACYARKRKNGKLSETDKKECKKWAAIRYYKETGKPATHAKIFSLIKILKKIIVNK